MEDKNMSSKTTSVSIENNKSNSYKYNIKIDGKNLYHIFTFKKIVVTVSFPCVSTV